MSVFQLQDWWSVKVTQDATEEFDMASFCVGNADNAYPTSNKILVGSQSGVLRMYHPTKPNFRIEDLVLEEMLGAPILQVALGRFIPGSELLGVAILHPRELVVYEILPQAVKEDRVSYYTLRRVYSHDLGIDGKHFTAFNMTYGAFGGVRGRDMILVQSMDGKWQIFEQSAHAFTRQLADCLLPGPLVYIPKIDSFVTVNYAGMAECYRYQVLASSQSETLERRSAGESKLGESKSEVGGFGIRAVRNTVCEWTTNLGESARQILLGSFLVNEQGVVLNSGLANELLFLCDRSIFLVKAETGGIIQQRRLERSDPACACLIPYVAELPNGQTTTAHNFLLADQEGTVQVYQGFNLVWAARLVSPPVYMAISSFAGQRGLVITIDETGYLNVGYLGTKPAVQAVLSQVRDLDYDKIDEEHRALLQVIRDSQSDNKHETQDRLLMKCQIPKTFDLESVHGLGMSNFNDIRNSLVTFPANTVHGNNDNAVYMKMTVRVYLTYTGQQAASNVSIVVSTPPSILAHPKNVVLERVSGAKTTPTVVKVTFFALKNAVSTGSEVTITASYQSPKGEPGIITHNIDLPAFLTCKPKPPTKTANVKLILDTEYPAVPLTELFADILYAYQEAGMDVSDALGNNAAQAIGFQLHNPILKINLNQLETLQQALKSSGLLDKLSSQYNTATYGSNSNATLLPGSNDGSNSSADAATADESVHRILNENTQAQLPEVTSSLPLVSILVSKNAGRYRIQADSYSALYALCAELEKRLTIKLQTSPNTNLGTMSPSSKAKQEADHAPGHITYVTCAEALPVDEFCSYVAHHLSLRHLLLYKTRVLQDRATQYRMIEKRLLVRFKDKNPTPLHGLDVMLHDTYQHTLKLADEIESIQHTIVQLRHEIEAFAKLLVLMIAMKCQLSAPDRVALTAYLCPSIVDGMEQGWEETVTASLAHLLKTCLSKSGYKESSSSATMSSATLEIPKSVDTLRKNLLLVIDRLEKGGRIVTTSAASLQSSSATNNASASNNTNNNNNNNNNSGKDSRK